MRVAAILGILLLFAGCAEPQAHEPPVADSGPRTGDRNDAVVIDDPGAMPEWQVGDWWTYDVEFVNLDLSIETTIVVYGEEGSSWLVSGTDRDANVQAEFSHFPTLGPWTKSDLQATIHGAKIPFFNWPLTDGKTWSDPYRDLPATWTAEAAEVETPNGTVDGFDLGLVVADGQYANYSYARNVGWFTQLEQGFGQPAVRMQLLDYGRNHTGDVSVLSFVEHLHGPLPVAAVAQGAPPPGTDFQKQFTVGEGGSLAWGFFYGGAPGAYSFSFKPVGGEASQGVAITPHTTDGSVGFDFGEVTQPPPGEWVMAGGGASNGFGFAFGEILEIHEVIV